MAASCRARGVRRAGLGHPAIPTAWLFHGRGAWSQSGYARDRSHSQCTCLAHRLSTRHALEGRLVRTLASAMGLETYWHQPPASPTSTVPKSDWDLSIERVF